MRNFALLISVLFHPLLMCTYGCLLLFFGIENTVFDYLTSVGTKWRITLIVFIFSFIFPVLNIFILYKLKKIPQITLSNRRDRTFPYLMTALFYFGLFYLMLDINIWTVIKISVVGAGLAILFTAIINLKYKISAHMVGVGGLLGVLICVSYLIKFDMTPFYILVIFLAGLLGFARLKLEEHQPYQIYTGFLLGLFVQAGLFFILQKIVYT
ncbi:MAG TPA: hypothetical protein PL029_03185 [Bacteroidia bacterium]|nr:hypothetical protein [Bacteroidia bacterium]